jgi:DNA polymerase type B, organellar and viral
LCDTLNYFQTSLASLGKSIGLPKLPMPRDEDNDEVWEHYCSNDVDVAATAVDALIAFVRVNNLGPWQPTTASLAFSAYRSAHMKHKVLVHTYRPVIKLERECYYGGIVDTPVVDRKIDGPIYELDVCSMYPAVCRCDLPYHFVGWTYATSVGELERLSKDYHLAAKVTLETITDVYPVRLANGTYYPHGRYTTSLAHPELMEAIHRGQVQKVHQVSWYRRAPIFATYMDWMVEHKQAYGVQGNDAFRTACKLLANSLYGKCGQKTPRWVQWGRDALKILESVHGLPTGTLSAWYNNPPDLYLPEEVIHLTGIRDGVPVRDIYGVVELKIGDWESRDSCPIIAATVTSYARVLLRNLQRIAGNGHWFYSDTDSIWVDQTGRENLLADGQLQSDVLGFLSLRSAHDWLTVHSPKDYETPDMVKRKGVRPNAEEISPGTFRQLQFPGAKTQILDGLDGGVYVRHLVKSLHRTITRCVVMADGNTRPLVFPDELPD